MASRDIGAHAELMEAVLRVVDRDGFRRAEPMSASVAAELAGVSRGTIYARWPSTALLAGDVIRFGATEHPGWQRRLVGADPSSDPMRVVQRLVEGPHREAGLYFRCAAAQMAPEYEVRDAVSHWEQAWVCAFAEWLELHLAATGRALRPGVTALDLALALTSLVEGTLLGAVLVHGPFYTEWPDGGRRALVVAFGAVLDGSTCAATGAGPPAPPAPVPDVRPERWDDGTLALLASIFYGTLREQVVAGRPAPAVRLVDPDALAAELGVGRRRVFQFWDSAAECNADLLEVLVDRYQQGSTPELVAAVDQLLEATPPGTRKVVEALFVRLLEQADRADRRSFLECTFATRDPTVLARSAEVQRRHRAAMLPHHLALMQAIGRTARPGLTLFDTTTLLAGAILGAERLHNSQVPEASSASARATQLARALWLVVDGLLAPWEEAA